MLNRRPSSPRSGEGAEELREQLTSFVTGQLGPDAAPAIHELTRMASGFSRENWCCEASWLTGNRRVHQHLIIRRDPLSSVVETDRYVEFTVLRALAGGAVPTPEVLWVDTDGKELGRPTLVMRRYEGVGERFLLSSPELGGSLAERIALAETGLRHLVALHALDWRSRGLGSVLDDPGTDGASAEVARWEVELERQALEPQPELLEAAAWLRANAPTAQCTSLVHGDWKPGNWLVDRARFVVALDWELVHLGDPLEDLGWVTNPMRRSMHEIPGHYERSEIVERYAAWSGRDVNDAELTYWNVFSAFKIAVIELTGVRSFCRGLAERPWRADWRLHRYLLEATD